MCDGKIKSGIYALCCPDTGEVKYIGQSINIPLRFSQHKCGIGRSGSAKWVRSLKEGGKVPVLKILERCLKEDLNDKEVEFIVQYGLKNLLNTLPGGAFDPAFSAKKTDDILSVEGFAHPYMVFTRSVWFLRNSKKACERLKEISKEWKECKTEEQRINFSMNCAQWVVNNAKHEVAHRMEQYLIKVIKQINEKYPKRFTLRYRDGVEVTP